MTDCQECDRTRDDALGRSQGHESAIVFLEVFHETFESHFAAERFDLPANRLDHGRQAVAAEMGTMFVENRRRSLAVHEQLENSLDIWSSGAAG